MSGSSPRTFEFPRGPIVEILWLDSAGGHGWSKREDELRNDGRYRAMHRRSVGYVILEDDDVIELVSGISGEDFVSCTTMVPKFAIVEKHVLDAQPNPTPISTEV